jgi:hypothetical protein
MFIDVYNVYYMIVPFLILRFSWPKITAKLKIRFIYPRMGYIKLSKNHESKKRTFYITFAIVWAQILTAYFIAIYFVDWRIDTFLKYSPIIIALAYTANSIYFWLFSGKWYHILYGVFAIISAIVWIQMPLPSGNHHIIYFIWTQALFTLIIGITKFFNFIKLNPIITELEEEEA